MSRSPMTARATSSSEPLIPNGLLANLHETAATRSNHHAGRTQRECWVRSEAIVLFATPTASASLKSGCDGRRSCR